MTSELDSYSHQPPGSSDGAIDYSERTPLLHQDSFRVNITDDENGVEEPGSGRLLGVFSGVFTPVALSMFSTVLFLRLGFVVGQSGVLLTLLQFVLAYFILYMTILSICAISTNGAVEGGGAYFMISRALGPEFGGSIGFLFFLANIFSCALYISGFVEGFVDNFGPNGGILPPDMGVPAGTRWWSYLYATVVLAFCLIVCLIGGAMFARTSVFILGVVVFCTLMVILSTFIKTHEICVAFPAANNESHYQPNLTEHRPYCLANETGDPSTGAYYTTLKTETFKDNLFHNYTIDYATGNQMSFFTVFAVLFSSVTGIMNGANMSGELINPSKAIPLGTMTAALFTFLTYTVMTILTALSTSRELLINNYNYLQSVNVWPPFVLIGIFAATLSAALGNLIGASRILEALAKDQVFWKFLNPATWTTKGGNPIIAVFISWILVQLVLLIGSLNAIAPITSIFFLLSYAATNLACLGLEVASAPNFRPTFEYFSWHTCVLGMVGCVVMCFFINAVMASIAMAVCFALIVALHLRTFPQTWGSISQALIFHQVRKYLLMLDSRKDHIKFWRPQMLFLVSNPRASPEVMEFINDIKKGGLYVLGHVKIGNLDRETLDPCVKEYHRWLTLIDTLHLKAFVELTLAPTVREGMHHLIRVSGLGGMKPNTICLGFYDETPPLDTIMTRNKKRSRRLFQGVEDSEDNMSEISEFAPVRGNSSSKLVNSLEYLGMLQDIVKMKKNVCLFRYFQKLNKEAIITGREKQYIDVWPVNFFRPESSNYFDSTCLFMLQLACILHMVPAWKKHTHLRIFVCVEEQAEDTARKQRKLSDLLEQLRIIGEIKLVPWQTVTSILHDSAASDAYTFNDQSADVKFPEEYLKRTNELIREHSGDSAVLFLYLPKVPMEYQEEYNYLSQLEKLTSNLPPTVFVHGIHPVTSTTL